MALYVTATPIGNMGDMSERAVETLRNVDVIAAEDTRVALTLLRRFDVTGKKLVSCHKFNERSVTAALVEMLIEGRDIALVSDAGTPGVSDPGSVLVAAAAEAGVEVVSVSGPSAVAAALSVSGFNAPAFTFYGFLPRRAGEKREVFRRLEREYAPVSVFYESPARIKETLIVLGEVLPDAKVCLCNDLTKLYERVYRGSPETVLSELNANAKSEKGEYTLVVETAAGQEEDPEEITMEARLADLMVKRGLKVREASSVLCEEYGASRNAVYKAALKLKELFAPDVTM